MKKIASFALLFCILATALSLPIFSAKESGVVQSPEQNYETYVLNNALTYTCVYDPEQKRVNISGSLNKDVFKDYSAWTLCVYAVPAGSTEWDVVADPKAVPVAEALISIKFEFSLKADQVSYKYSRYAVFLRSPSGKLMLTSEPQYPEVRSTFEGVSEDRNYKGVYCEFSSFVSDIDAGTVILPVYVNSLVSSTSSSMFILADKKQQFFNKDVIDTLDIAVRSLSVTGAKIYFRLLYKTDENDTVTAEYELPRMDDPAELVKLHAVVSFLSERWRSIRKKTERE